MQRIPLAALTAIALLSGCFGGAAADLSVTLTTHLVDKDGDDRKDIEVLAAFQGADAQHTRVAGDGTLMMERARGDHRSQELNYTDYGRAAVRIDRDSDKWRDLGEAVIYVHTIEDHQVDSGYSYRLTLSVELDAGGTVSDTIEVYYQRR